MGKFDLVVCLAKANEAGIETNLERSVRKYESFNNSISINDDIS
jgi:hypothetical protein